MLYYRIISYHLFIELFKKTDDYIPFAGQSKIFIILSNKCHVLSVTSCEWVNISSCSVTLLVFSVCVEHKLR